MGNNGSDGVVTPFGVEQDESAAPSSADALSTFLQDGALVVVAAVIVGVFLLYQFGRYFWAGRMASDGLGDIPPREAPAAAEPQADAGAPEDESTAPRMQRPWQTQ